ncbi:MAG: porin [Acidobacteria bacterium]|nr:porin [Acidobacteriota bacterium]
MRHHLTGLTLALAALASPAAAQDVWDDPGGIETAATYETAIVGATDGSEALLYTARGAFEMNYVLQNGAEVGFRASGGLDKDNPGRAGFSGIVGPAQPLTGPAGAFTGLARGPGFEDAGPRGRIETGYIYIEGGYGELRAGLDEGAATRFFEGAPTLFRYASLANPALDPSGLSLVRTDHDLTGPSLKVSYATPRILGVRAGVSLTPEANAPGLDRDPSRLVGGQSGPHIEDALELALNVSRRLPRSGVRIRAGAAWSQADASQAALPGIYDTVETWSAGGSLEFSSFALGASYLDSTNGFAAAGDYTALSAALRVNLGKFDTGLEYAESDDDGLGAESDSIGLSLGRNLNENIRVVGGWQRLDTRYRGNPVPLAPETRETSDGIVIEITLSG